MSTDTRAASERECGTPRMQPAEEQGREEGALTLERVLFILQRNLHLAATKPYKVKPHPAHCMPSTCTRTAQDRERSAAVRHSSARPGSNTP
jgi:hypothetical protein